jgi:hypothetical protein
MRILTCFENKIQVAATPMPQMYQNKMVRNISVKVSMICAIGLSTDKIFTISCYNCLGLDPLQ